MSTFEDMKKVVKKSAIYAKIDDLLNKKAVVDAELKKLLKEDREKAIDEIREAVTLFKITEKDIFGKKTTTLRSSEVHEKWVEFGYDFKKTADYYGTNTSHIKYHVKKFTKAC